MNKSPLFYISFLTIFVALIFLIWAFFQILYPFKVLEFKDPEFPVTTKQLRTGDELHYLVRYCKYKDLPAYVTYQLVNSIIIPSSQEKVAQAEPGCGEHENIFIIPEIGSTGVYRLVMIVEYKISALRTVIVKGKTEQFEIIK